jgi:cytochrome d ubiquinol oxidase subunit I
VIGVGVALGSNASGLLITSVNAFMQYPMIGTSIVDGQLQVDFVETFLNEASIVVSIHVLLGGWLYAFGLVLALYAYKLLRGIGSESTNWAAFKLASVAFAIPIPIIGFVGDQQGKMLAKYTPATLAALEGARETIESGFPNFLAYGDWNAPIRGLIEYPADYQHPMLNLQWYAKLGLAVFMALIALVLLLKVARGKPISKAWLRLAILNSFLAIVINILGWYIKELGRLPWVIYGLVKVSDIASPSFVVTTPALLVLGGLLATVLLGISYTAYVIVYKGQNRA